MSGNGRKVLIYPILDSKLQQARSVNTTVSSCAIKWSYAVAPALLQRITFDRHIGIFSRPMLGGSLQGFGWRGDRANR
jgi:hypothetical protein